VQESTVYRRKKKEIFDKTIELADMFHNYIHRNAPSKEDLSQYFRES
jgi:dsDNA-binding SOS-regulon protein